MRVRSVVMLVCLSLVMGCSGAGCSTDGGASDDAQRAAQVVTTQPAKAKKAEPVKAEPPPPPPDPIETLKRSARMRLSLTAFDHFADRSWDGNLHMDLGTVSGRKYTNGGWRAGWDAVPRAEGDVRYMEVDSKTSRLFFKHPDGAFERIVVKIRSVRPKNTVGFFLNDEALTSVEVGEGWQEVVLEVPAKAARAGENQLMMRMKRSTKRDGRKQYAHVASVSVLKPGADVKAMPRGELVQNVTMGGARAAALALVTPQTVTWRLQLPEEPPKLALALGAARGGAALNVTVRSDAKPKGEVVHQETFADDQTDRWLSRVVGLEAYAGQVVELEVTAGGDWASGQLVALDAAMYAAAPQDKAAAPKAPSVHAKHVLIYLIDTLRYDKLGVYNPKSSVKTPHLDAFARDGLIFDAAYDAENWTKPSTATILTSLYPSTHKAKEADSKLPNSAVMLSEHLRAQGFRTGSFIANGYVSNKFGFDQGWHYYTNYIRENKRTDAERVVDDALKWIDKSRKKDPNKRLFTYLHTIDPHVPYSAPDAWKYQQWKARKKGKYRGPVRAQSTGNQLADIKTGSLKMSRDDKLYLEDLYDGEVAYNDHEFGRLVEGLKSRGIYDDTVIVVLVDHGEEFWDHGSVGHGHSVYDEMVHSPLFVRYPNKVPTGRRVPHVVSLAGVVPTVLEMLGAEALSGAEGTSFADAFDGVGSARPRVAVSDFMYRKKGVRAGRYHWLTTGQGGELFDLKTDRKEKNNLIKKHAIARAFVRGHFGLFMGAGDKSRWWLDEHGAKRDELEIDVADLDPETRRQLEAMGYIDGATSDHSAKEDKKLMEQEDKE